MKKIDYNLNYFEYSLSFKCKCGRELSQDDNDYDFVKCKKCKKIYHIIFLGFKINPLKTKKELSIKK